LRKGEWLAPRFEGRVVVIRIGRVGRIRSKRSTEVVMSGRRRHERFAPAQPWDGALKVLRDVIVQEEPSGALVTIGQAPGVIGEQMTLDVAGAGHVVTLKVRVQESRPVILDGNVRHRVRLEVLERSRRPEVAETFNPGVAV